MKVSPSGGIPISVVIATTHPWPELAMTLESLWPQIQRLQGELIIADGNGHGLPADFATRYPGTIAILKPGESIFALRSAGIQRTRGEIVAVTEDHCRLPPDWCARLLECHRIYPEAAVVSGSVENGSPDALIDWANFFIAHAPMMSPVKDGEAKSISLAGAAFKRSALPQHSPPQGVMEMLYIQELSRRGGKFFTSSKISLDHVQAHGFWKTFAIHFHNGRSIAGFRRQKIGPWMLLARIGSCAILPLFLLHRSGFNIIGKRRFLPQLLMSFPLMAALATCHAAGELTGYLTGAGNSPLHLS